MEYWLPIVYEHDVTQFPALARKAEELGFAGVALPDHVVVPAQRDTSGYAGGYDPFEFANDWHEPFTAITAMAMATTTLRFMTYVYVLPMRDPFSVAKVTATVSALSGGRFALGCGVGWFKDEMTLLGHDPRTRGRRMDEMLDVMQGFWRHGTFEYHGEFYDFGPASMLPVPQDEPQVWIGGGRPSLARSVRCDGWVAMQHPPDELCDILDELAEMRRVHAEEHGPPARPQQTLVVPDAEPTIALYDRIESHGTNGVMGVPWPMADPAYLALEPKLKAMEDYADTYIRR